MKQDSYCIAFPLFKRLVQVSLIAALSFVWVGAHAIETEEMEGDIIATKGVVRSWGQRANGGYISLGRTGGGTFILPAIDARAEGSAYGLLVSAYPDDNQVTGFAWGAINLTAERRWSGEGGISSVSSGLLLRVDNQGLHHMSLTYDGQLRLGETPPLASLDNFTSAPIYVANKAYMDAFGNWQTISTRAAKKNIKEFPSIDAWKKLDSLKPVEFEYRKTQTRVRMKDGRDLTFEEAAAEVNKILATRYPKGSEIPSGEFQLILDSITSGPPYSVRLDKGVGSRVKGFIAEELPDDLSPDHKSYSPTLVTVTNTAALKEAKRLIEELQVKNTKLEEKIQTLDALVKTGNGGGKGLVASSGTDVLWQPDTQTLERVSEWVLNRLTGTTDIEIPIAEAWVEVPETRVETRVRTATRYRYNLETQAIESYPVSENYDESVPTGQKVRRLKEGVRFDETSGKFYLQPVSSTGGAKLEGTVLRLVPAGSTPGIRSVSKTQPSPEKTMASSGRP